MMDLKTSVKVAKHSKRILSENKMFNYFSIIQKNHSNLYVLGVRITERFILIQTESSKPQALLVLRAPKLLTWTVFYLWQIDKGMKETFPYRFVAVSLKAVCGELSAGVCTWLVFGEEG